MKPRFNFLNETVVRSDAHRGTTWCEKGETHIIRNSGGRFGLKLISVVSPCGDMHFQLIKEKMNSTKFIQFLKRVQKDAGYPILQIMQDIIIAKRLGSLLKPRNV